MFSGNQRQRSYRFKKYLVGIQIPTFLDQSPVNNPLSQNLNILALSLLMLKMAPKANFSHVPPVVAIITLTLEAFCLSLAPVEPTWEEDMKS